MTRDLTPLYINDLSDFAKTLRKALSDAPELPGHLALLGVIAKAAGYRNYQQLKAEAPATPALTPLVDKALRVFDAQGRMKHWPAQTRIQGLCLWAMWGRLPSRVDLTEKDVNAVLQAGNCFGDHVLMRRSLIDHGLVQRAQDGSTYRRIEQVPPPEAMALIRAVQAA